MHIFVFPTLYLTLIEAIEAGKENNLLNTTYLVP